MQTKRELILKREQLRAKLQIQNLESLLKTLKEDVRDQVNTGYSLPAAENQMEKVGQTCRKIQWMYDPKYKLTEPDEETPIDEIERQINQIEDELLDPYVL